MVCKTISFWYRKVSFVRFHSKSIYTIRGHPLQCEEKSCIIHKSSIKRNVLLVSVKVTKTISPFIRYILRNEQLYECVLACFQVQSRTSR